MNLALRFLVKAQLRVMARTPEEKLPEMASDFARVRDNIDKYRNTAYLRQSFSPRR